MMPISHYVGLILSHGVQMCSFFSIICCKRLENASRYTTRLKQLTLVMNIGYLDFNGPSEKSQSVSRAKTHMTLKCTFWSKIGLFGGFGKYSGKALLTFFFSLAKPTSIVYVSEDVMKASALLCSTVSRRNLSHHRRSNSGAKLSVRTHMRQLPLPATKVFVSKTRATKHNKTN